MKIKWKFVKHGDSIDPGKNELAVDVSLRSIPQTRIFDHHSTVDTEYNCSAAALIARINELDPLRNEEEVVIYSHSQPDADGAVSSFLAVSYLMGDAIFDNKKDIKQLTEIVGKIDQGEISPVSLETEESGFNFYTFFLLLDDFIKNQKTKETWDIIEPFISQSGLELSWESYDEQFIAYSFVFLEQIFESGWLTNALTLVREHEAQYLKSLDEFPELGKLNKQLQIVFTKISKFVANTLEKGRRLVQDTIRKGKYAVFPVKTPLKNKSGEYREAQVLYVKLPFLSIPFLKALRGTAFEFFQNRKIDVLAFEPWEEEHRAIISVEPNSDIYLKGLGLALDRKNNERCGKRRLKYSRYWRRVNDENKPDPLFLYQDPWYDGRNFNYTIVDAPASPSNRHLTPGEIKEILKSNWYNLACEYESDEYIEWLHGEEKFEKPAEKFQKKYLIYPLVSLFPIQIDLLWIVTLQKGRLWENSKKHFEALVGKRPQWPMGIEEDGKGRLDLTELVNYIEACQKNEDLREHLSAFKIMNHLLEWLNELYKEANDDLNILRDILKDGLSRLFRVRDEGKKHETQEINMQDVTVLPQIELRIARFCDYILEEIEELSIHLNDPFPKIHNRVDAAQAFTRKGDEILAIIDERRKKLFAPFLNNISAFLESFDRVLHRFESDDLEIPDEMIFLLGLPLGKKQSQTWYSAFSEFVQKKLVYKGIKDNPDELFQFPYWAYAVLGPRIIGELYVSTINQAINHFDYSKARTYFKRLKEIFIKPLPFFKQFVLTSKLVLSRKKDDLRKFTGLKIKNSSLLECYKSQFQLPFMLKIIFGVGLLVMSEMDYGLWNCKISNSSLLTGHFVVFSLLLGVLFGSYSLIPGKKRMIRAVSLSIRLFISAIIPALFSCLVFPTMYRIYDLSFLFLVFGSIFFAVVVNTIGSIKKK